MRKSLVILALLISMSVLVPFALAASWNSQDTWTGSIYSPEVTDLTITPGASGAWVTGGYNFHGTADAQTAGFYALDDLTAFTCVIWINTNDIGSAAYQRFLYQYYDGSNEFDLIQHQDDVGFILEIGATHIEIYVNSLLVVGEYTQLVCAWNSSSNSGKLDLYVNATLGTSASGVTGTTDLPSVFRVGAASYNGIVYSLAIYDFKFTADQVADNLLYGPDYRYPNATHFYNMNEGTGTTFNDFGNGWIHQDTFAASINQGTYTWTYQETFNTSMPAVEEPAPVDYAGTLAIANAFVGFLGIPIMIGSCGFLGWNIREKTLDKDRFLFSIIAFCIGLFLLIGAGA